MSYVKQCECGNITCASTPRKYICICGAALELELAETAKPFKNIEQPSRGLGDTIYKITSAFHIPHCGDCERRREALNALVPYKKT